MGGRQLISLFDTSNPRVFQIQSVIAALKQFGEPVTLENINQGLTEGLGAEVLNTIEAEKLGLSS